MFLSAKKRNVLRPRLRNRHICCLRIKYVTSLWVRTVMKYNALSTEDDAVEQRLRSPGSVTSNPHPGRAVCVPDIYGKNTLVLYTILSHDKAGCANASQCCIIERSLSCCCVISTDSDNVSITSLTPSFDLQAIRQFAPN